MPKIKYLLLSESHHYGWNASYIKLREANKLFKDETLVVYIFKVDIKKFDKLVLDQIFENCSCLKINNYDGPEEIKKNNTYIEVNLQTLEIKYLYL